MSEPIILEHIDWVNDMDPALCDQNLNKDQKALEACVEVANKYNGLKNANNEERYNYPNDKYLANSNVLKDITAALISKGVESTGIFKNIPPEIRSIQTGGIAPTAVINECIKANLVGKYHIIEASISRNTQGIHNVRIRDELTGAYFETKADPGQYILPGEETWLIPLVNGKAWGTNGIYIIFSEKWDEKKTLLSVYEINEDETELGRAVSIDTGYQLTPRYENPPIVTKKFLIIQGV